MYNIFQKQKLQAVKERLLHLEEILHNENSKGNIVHETSFVRSQTTYLELSASRQDAAQRSPYQTPPNSLGGGRCGHVPPKEQVENPPVKN